MTDHVRTITKGLDELRVHGYSRRDIFEDWLAAAYHYLRMIPVHALSVAEHGTLADDDEEGKRDFDRIEKRYGGDRSRFADATRTMIEGAYIDGPMYCDFVGEVYEAWELHNEYAGQYFTPESVCRATAAVADDQVEKLRTKLIAELEQHEPSLAVMHAMEVPVTDSTYAMIYGTHAEKVETPQYLVNDPACGSFRMPLAFAARCPRWMITTGAIGFSGQDIDGRCVKMARINAMLYGLRGDIEHHNTLSGETMACP